MDRLQIVQETIDMCLQQGTPTAQSLELVDRTVFLLQISSSLIDNFMFAIRSSSATSFVLAGELQEVLSQLLVQWETELLHLEGRSLQTPGRPKIIINVEMVSVYLRSYFNKAIDTLNMRYNIILISST